MTKNRKSGKSAAQDEKMHEDSTPEQSPEKKKSRQAEDEEFDSTEELDEEGHKIAAYITKNVSVKLSNQVSSDIKEAFKDFGELLANLTKTSNLALETATEAIKVAKAGEEKMVEVEKAVNARVDQVEKDAHEKIAEAEKKAADAQQKAEEALASVSSLGKMVAEFENKLRLGQPAGNFLQTMAAQEGPTLFEESVQPTTTPADRLKKLFVSYSNAIHAAKTTRTFILGRKKGETEPTQAAAKLIMECFFPDVGCIVTKTDKSKVAKVYVPKAEEAAQLKLAMKNTWQALGSQGWWMREDIPEQLGKLETRARDFFTAAKEVDKSLDKRIGYITIEYGIAAKDGKELLPLFLIPPQSSSKWPALFKLIVERIESIGGDALMGDYASTNDEKFFSEWLRAAGMDKLADDIYRARASADAQLAKDVVV